MSFCNIYEPEYHHYILKVLNNFTEKFFVEEKDRSIAERTVLVFPPFSSKGRYLVHRCVASVDGISSVSVSRGIARRVVCYQKGQRIDSSYQLEDHQQQTPASSSASQQSSIKVQRSSSIEKGMASSSSTSRYSFFILLNSFALPFL